MQQTTAHFTITGEFIARSARGLMLDDEPGKAWRLLADCLVGDGAADVARKVLAGEADLTGDSVRGVGVAERGEDGFDVEAADEYIADLHFVYAGRFRRQGKWYRPRAVVVAFGPTDAKAAGFCPSVNTENMAAWSHRRAKHYAQRGEYVCVCTYSDEDGEHARHVIFEPCGELPQWWKPPATAQAALDAWVAAGNSLEHTGYDGRDYTPSPEFIARKPAVMTEDELRRQEEREAQEDARREAEMLRIGERVREQAGDDVFEMTLLDGRVVKVPRAPFTLWAFRSAPKKPALPPWNTVAEQGWKMLMDDPNHTDWVLGAGLTLAEAYKENVTHPAYSIMVDMQVAEVDRG